MSRLQFPIEFSNQVTLLKAVHAKNTADGTASPLKLYLTQHNINLSTAENTANAAQAHDTSRLTLVKQGNNYRQLRDMEFDPVFSNVKKGAQFLKSLFGENFAELGAWGLPIDANGKINYPANFADRKNLFGAFYAKYSSYPAGESPLQVFIVQNNINMADDAGAVQDTDGYEISFTMTIKQAENETQLRDLLWQPIVKILRGIGDFLKNLYAENDRQLGLWGFTVDNSVLKPKVVTKKLKLVQQKTYTSIALGTTILNMGPENIVLHKGKLVNGNPVVLKPGERMGIERGWTTTTIVNASKLETAVFQLTVNK